MKKLLRSGVHFAVRSLAMFAVWITATAVAARVDTPTLAAHQVLTQLFMFLALMLDALGDSRAVAGGRRARPRRHQRGAAGRPHQQSAVAVVRDAACAGARRVEPRAAVCVQQRSRRCIPV